MMVAATLGTMVALSAAAQAGSRADARQALHRPARVVVAASPPVIRDPYWIPDYNIVPRYRYRPQDDRVDTSPYAPRSRP